MYRYTLCVNIISSGFLRWCWQRRWWRSSLPVQRSLMLKIVFYCSKSAGRCLHLRHSAFAASFLPHRASNDRHHRSDSGHGRSGCFGGVGWGGRQGWYGVYRLFKKVLIPIKALGQQGRVELEQSQVREVWYSVCCELLDVCRWDLFAGERAELSLWFGFSPSLGLCCFILCKVEKNWVLEEDYTGLIKLLI